MIIQEINEYNFLYERKKGEEDLNRKFELYDSIKNEKISDIDTRKKLAELFKDPSIWAYATLKDKQNKPLKVYPFQDRLINDSHRFVHCTAANQTGKTWSMGCIKPLHHALHVPNASVMVISKSEPQAIMVLDEIKWMLKRSGMFDTMIGDIENRTELSLKSPLNGVSVIRSFAPTTTALGYPATLLVLDETGFWEKNSELTPTDFYTQVLEPRTNATKNWAHPFLTMGQIVSITNPNGEQGLAYNLFKDERFHQYVYSWLANPHNPLDEYLNHKKRLPPYRFASIYAATYMSPEGGFITLDQYNTFANHNHDLIIPTPCTLYLGGDMASEDAKGKNTDWNVLYGVIQSAVKGSLLPRIKLVYVKEWPPGTKKEVVYNEIDRLAKMPGVTIAKFAYDRIGVGDKIFNDLKERGILSAYQMEPLTYSLPNKTDVYLNFQSLFEHGLVEGKDVPKLKDQLLGLKVEQKEGSLHLKIHHKTEGLKDDHPDAFANACYAAKVLRGSEPYIGITKKGYISNVITRGLQTLICPECEKVDYQGKSGYYHGKSPSGLNFERINCPRHSTQENRITI